jgi:hypothetical protein
MLPVESSASSQSEPSPRSRSGRLGKAWTDLFADAVNVAPFAPFHGLTFAAALVAGSLILRLPGADISIAAEPA